MAGGKILLSGFKIDEAERTILNNLISNYKHKISQHIDFKEIRLRLKKSRHGKTFLHEIQGQMIENKIYSAKATDYNLFAALAEVFEKLMNEAGHNQRTKRQR